MILEEEMRRVIVFGRWRADWWSQKAQCIHIIDNTHSEGLSAYALEHSDLELSRVALMEGKWVQVRAQAQLVLADLVSRSLTALADSRIGTIEVEIDIEEHKHEEELL